MNSSEGAAPYLTSGKDPGRVWGAARYFLFILLCAFLAVPELRAERIKDIAKFEGVRENQLIGYGIVVGLDGTGDKGKTAVQGIANMLTRMGVTVDPKDVKSKSIAAAVVTATLPPFAKPGMKIDALVSTIGDAGSIQGGTLLLAPLKGPDGMVYGLAQGPVSIGGFAAEGEGASLQKNHPTAGKIPEGVTIEREPRFTLGNGDEIRLFLQKADFATVDGITRKINEEFQGEYAFPIDPSAVKVIVPPHFRENLIGMITRIEDMDVPVDMTARVIINERTGTIVIGNNVRISPVAIAHGSLAIEIMEQPEVSQPLPFAPRGSETVVVPRTGISINEQKASLVQVSGVTLGEVVRALNTLGVTPRDLISILQALKAAGALRAELEII
ncbi:MAG: flagellar basal body P-ring protein FlgI [Nitrospiraceae bacterium]|nr:MAG: flagellar basal body P-ring protein FlgI [Nitrospiraceae bacterium]